MKIVEASFTQFEGKPKQWTVDSLCLGPVNLLVGRNASGKSRSLTIIKSLASLLSGKRKQLFVSGDYDVLFRKDEQKIRYRLKYEDSNVVHEEVEVDNITRLQRGEGGKGEIFAEELGKMLTFQTPTTEIAAVARRDSIQHRFLEPLTAWSTNVLHYPFGSSLGQNSLFAQVKEELSEPDLTKTDEVVSMFIKGDKELGPSFAATVKEDMKTVGYPLDRIGTMRPDSLTFRPEPPATPLGLYVHELSLKGLTDQVDMSQGMFRTLSLLIQLSYACMSTEPSCILIDDIGEGLDFERSCALIELIMAKAREANIQLVMATNDRFVMNVVPLETWSILKREGGNSRVYNYENSRSLFDDFQDTGLNNFDFFATDFVGTGEATDEETGSVR